MPLWEKTRKWSLEYFDYIYKRLGTHFDRLFFESEVFELGRSLVEKFKAKGVFEDSQEAVIFPGEKYGLHNRVFITKDGILPMGTQGGYYEGSCISTSHGRGCSADYLYQ